MSSISEEIDHFFVPQFVDGAGTGMVEKGTWILEEPNGSP